jgi:hypothetical protein
VALLWKINLLIVAICVASIAIAGDTLIAFVSSDRLWMGTVMLIMLIGLGAAGQSQLINSSMQIFSYTHQLRYFSLLAILVPISVIIGSHWGLIGVVIGIMLSLWILNSTILMWLNRQDERIELDWYGALRGIALAALSTIVGWIVGQEYSAWWGLGAVLLLYCVGLVLVKPLNRNDMALLRRGLRQQARFFTPFVWNNPKY